MRDFSIPVIAVSDSFFIDIPEPLAKAHGVSFLELDEIIRILSTTHIEGQGLRLNVQNKHSVLIIDDDRHLTELLKCYLHADFRIETAYSGEEGIKLWQDHRHDLILLDFLLPGIHGDKVLKHIMAIDPMQPIIVLTGSDRQDQDLAMILAGACDYLQKPISFDGLLLKLQGVLRNSLLRYQNHYAETHSTILSSYILAIETTLKHDNPKQALGYIDQLKQIAPLTASEDEIVAILTDNHTLF